MANVKKTLSEKSGLSVTVRGRKAFEDRYTPQQILVLRWEAECLEAASSVYPRTKTKKEYIAKAYDTLLKKHYKKPDVSMKSITDTYYASLRNAEYRSNHVYNLTIELGYTKDAQRERRQAAAAQRDVLSLPPSQSRPSKTASFWMKVSNFLSR